MGYISFPNAKINIGLNVVSKRADGYHNIESLFYPIAFTDVLECIPSEGLTRVELIGENPPKMQLEDNSVYKAWALLHKHHHIPNAHFVLLKNIPAGAGLGGGSSDAAFALKTLSTLHHLNLSQNQLINYAASLGSDCSFFIHNTPAYITGVGDQIESFELDLSSYFVLLVCPDVFISTPEAYAHVIPKTSLNSLKDSLIQPVETWKEHIQNDFEGWAFKTHPSLQRIKEELYTQGAVYASMSGSGSSMYGIFKQEPSSSTLTIFKSFGKVFAGGLKPNLSK